MFPHNIRVLCFMLPSNGQPCSPMQDLISCSCYLMECVKRQIFAILPSSHSLMSACNLSMGIQTLYAVPWRSINECWNKITVILWVIARERKSAIWKNNLEIVLCVNYSFQKSKSKTTKIQKNVRFPSHWLAFAPAIVDASGSTFKMESFHNVDDNIMQLNQSESE